MDGVTHFWSAVAPASRESALAALAFGALLLLTFRWAAAPWRRRQGRGGSVQQLTLPNGLTVFSHQRGETEYLYEEVFTQREYLQHGVVLRPGDTVFDVGANVGMFSVFAAEECGGDITVHAFEPIPQIHDVCRRNVARHVTGQPGGRGLGDGANARAACGIVASEHRE